MSPASISPPAAASRGARLWRHAWQLTTCHSIGFLLWGFSWEDKIEQAEGQLLAVIMIDALLGIVVTQLILLRRRWPVTVAAVLIVAQTFSSWAMPATAVAIISVAARRRRGEIAALGALWLVSGVANDLVLAREVGASESLIQQGLLGSSTLVLVWMLVYAVLVSVGWNRGARAEIMESWRVGAELARREQVARVAQAQTAERARIAREMHDVLAHKISLISLHAGVLSYQDDLSREETAQTAGVIQETAHQALEELREVLGVLRDESHEAVAPPQPSLLDLPALVAAEEGAGSQVTLQVPDDFWQQAATLAPTTARHAHRIVQESLTNARKHAGGQPVSLRVNGGPDAGLQIQVVNPLGRNPLGHSSGGRNANEVPGAGLGLAGLQERASLAGGSLDIEERDGFFRVTARLPWNVRAS